MAPMDNSSSLLAVLLITRSRPGPRLVFHYPPVLETLHGKDLKRHDHDHESDAGSEDEEEEENDIRSAGLASNGQPAADDTFADTHIDAKSIFDHQRVFGYTVDSLEKVLSPGRWSDRKKFEICLNGLTFVGYPTYAKEDGSWSDAAEGTANGAVDARTFRHRDQNGSDGAVGHDKPATTTMPTDIPTRPKDDHDFTHVPESLDSQGEQSFATSMNSSSTASGTPPEQMNMFHVVFALPSSKGEMAARMYQHVAKKLSRALHYCQKQHDYVAVESRKLLGIKSKAKLQPSSGSSYVQQMIENSELAWALKEVYERISKGEVAGIRLHGMEMSLQLPNDEQDRGNVEITRLGPNAGLLLLEEKEILLRELSHPEASPLAYFIRELSPTKSLQKQAANLGMPINDVLYLAQHLLKWRKARAISPLHPRNIYIASPNARIDTIQKLATLYSRQFAALPSLPHVLKVLSGKPIKYGMLIPSRDHRAPYMEILAFLVKHGFVTQLKTFGWLGEQEHLHNVDTTPPAKSRVVPLGSSLLSPHLRPRDDDTMSVSSNRTAIPLSSTTAGTNTGSEDIAQEDSHRRTLILDPGDPSDREAEVLSHICAMFTDPEIRACFDVLRPFFDGEHAFETFAAENGLKRARVEELLTALEEQGYLIAFRAC